MRCRGVSDSAALFPSTPKYLNAEVGRRAWRTLPLILPHAANPGKGMPCMPAPRQDLLIPQQRGFEADHGEIAIDKNRRPRVLLRGSSLRLYSMGAASGTSSATPTGSPLHARIPVNPGVPAC